MIKPERRVVVGVFFFARGGSAHVTRSLCRSLPAQGWSPTLAVGSLGLPGDESHAQTFYAGLDVVPVDYSPAARLDDPLDAAVPFQPSYEDRPGSPDRVFAAVGDESYERLVAAWTRALAAARAGESVVLHLHHLTPLHEAALRAFGNVPVVGQLHGTELAMLREIEADRRRPWAHAEAWAARMRAWARACARTIVPPDDEDDVAALLGMERDRVVGLPSGVELDRFERRRLPPTERRALWLRWLVEDPQGWDESGRPGTVRYSVTDLGAFSPGGPVLLYVGRYTRVKRLPLLIRAYARAREQFATPAPLVLLGGHPGEWEGEHPLAVVRRIRARDVFLAGWRSHEQLADALNAADVIVHPSVHEAFGLVLIEGMACGIPAIAVDAHGPADIIEAGATGWLVPPDDEDALVEALVAAVNDPKERRRRGALAYARSRARYGSDAIASRIACVYDEAAGES